MALCCDDCQERAKIAGDSSVRTFQRMLIMELCNMQAAQAAASNAQVTAINDQTARIEAAIEAQTTAIVNALNTQP